MKQNFDVIVWGAGGMGSATMRSLALRGANVCGVEQFGAAHGQGSSHGETRIIRKAYFEHPDYVPLLNRSFELWREIADESGRQLQITNGLVVSGDPSSATIQGLQRCYAEHALPHERWTAEETRKHFPQFHLPGGHSVFFDPDGGYLMVEECVKANLSSALHHGATLYFGEQVLSWHADTSGVSVQTDQRELQAKALVLTAGAWAGRVFSEYGIPLEIWRKVLVWYRGNGLEAFSPQAFPTYFIELDYGGFYGFPVVSEAGFKAAEHFEPDIVAQPEALQRQLLPRDEPRLQRFLTEIFPALRKPKRSAFKVCMYTKSPDDHFVLGALPETPSVIVGAGFSGHGFKFAPVIGEILADLALDGQTSHPIDFLKLERFLNN